MYKCGHTAAAGKCISAGKVSGVEYTVDAADSGSADSRIYSADSHAASRIEEYTVRKYTEMSEGM